MTEEQHQAWARRTLESARELGLTTYQVIGSLMALASSLGYAHGIPQSQMRDWAAECFSALIAAEQAEAALCASATAGEA